MNLLSLLMHFFGVIGRFKFPIRAFVVTLNFANIVYVWFFVRETKGASLESMEVLFGTVESLPSKDAEQQNFEAPVQAIGERDKSSRLE